MGLGIVTGQSGGSNEAEDTNNNETLGVFA
jgi:hypothetical protein